MVICSWLLHATAAFSLAQISGTCLWSTVSSMHLERGLSAWGATRGDPHLRWACGTSGRGGFLTHVQIHGLQRAAKAHEKWEHPYLPPERWANRGTQSLGKKGERLQPAGPVRGASTRVHWWEPVHVCVPICLCTCMCVWLEHLGISYWTAFRNLLVFLNIL